MRQVLLNRVVIWFPSIELSVAKVAYGVIIACAGRFVVEARLG